MTSHATIRVECADEPEARRLEAALKPENGSYLSSRVEGSVLVLEADADAPLSLLHTLDDALACLSAAQKAGQLGRGSGPA